MFAPQWNLRAIRQEEALRQLPRAENGVIAWGDVRLAHVDTGHAPSVVFGDGAFGAATDGPSWVDLAAGRNLVEPDCSALDPLTDEGSPGHGARVASVIAGDGALLPPGAAPGDGRIAVAPRLPIVPVRAVDFVALFGEARRRAVGRGLAHAVRTGCAVANLSLGAPGFWPWAKGGLGRKVDAAYERGLIMVAAAGQIVDRVVYPAKYDRTIGVGGVTPSGEPYMRYGHGEPQIDVVAPASAIARIEVVGRAHQAVARPPADEGPGMGSSLFVAQRAFDLSSSAGAASVGLGAGTSYATAHVSAAAAIWLRARGRDIEAAYGPPSWRRVEAFRKLLGETARPLAAWSAIDAGLLDVAALIEADLPPVAHSDRAPEDARKFA